MQINKKIRSNQKEVDEYIGALEDYIVNFDASNIKRLIVACDEVAGVIADDIMLLKDNGDDEEIDNRFQMMGSKKNKIYQRYREIVGDLKNFKNLFDMVNDLKPKDAVGTVKEGRLKKMEDSIIKPKKVQDFLFEESK